MFSVIVFMGLNFGVQALVVNRPIRHSARDSGGVEELVGVMLAHALVRSGRNSRLVCICSKLITSAIVTHGPLRGNADGSICATTLLAAFAI